MMNVNTIAFYCRIVSQSFRRRIGRFKITFAAIVFSTAAIVCLLGLVEGLGDVMIRNAVAIQAGHVLASWPNRAGEGADFIAACQSADGVSGVLPRTRSIGMLSDGRGCYALATVYGVDPRRERLQTVVAQRICAGTYLAEAGDIVIGQELAGMLRTDVGGTVVFRHSTAPERTYRVSGIFRTGIKEMDSFLAFTYPQENCDSREVCLFLQQQDDAPTVAARLGPLVPVEGRVMTWRQMMPDLVQLIEVNRAGIRIVIALVLMVLGFGISNTIYLAVAERTREFGVLKAMGMSPSGVGALVLGETGLLVTLGGVAGSALGGAIVVICRACGGLDLSIWTSTIPLFSGSGIVQPRLTAAALVIPLAVTVGCGLLASLLPARRAGRVSVVAALRHV